MSPVKVTGMAGHTKGHLKAVDSVKVRIFAMFLHLKLQVVHLWKTFSEGKLVPQSYSEGKAKGKIADCF